MPEGTNLKPIFSGPCGPSDIPQSSEYCGFGWNNMSMGVGGGDEDEVVVCGICGTKHEIPRGGEALTYMRFLGKEGIEECCGRAADVLYGEFGEEFTMVFLFGFAANPTDLRYALLRRVLPEVMQKALQNLAEVTTTVKGVQESIEGMTQQTRP